MNQASRSRGAEMLIRKFQNKRADEFRRITERRPLEPNLELLARPGNNFKSPKCAAELKDQQADAGGRAHSVECARSSPSTLEQVSCESLRAQCADDSPSPTPAGGRN